MSTLEQAWDVDPEDAALAEALADWGKHGWAA